MSPSVGVVIPTYQAAKDLPFCLPPLLRSALKPRILVIDSSSTDGTVQIAQEMGVETMIIPKSEFNHGKTREKGRKFLNTSVVVMLTQDAYLVSAESLEALVVPLFEKKASIAYGRQLPRLGASFLESFPRTFNYPADSETRGIEDFARYGAYTFFCSDSFAAYTNSALDEIGGFPSVTFGEDTIAVAQLLRRGHRIAYVAQAEVYHSHSYTVKEEFRRHFDMGGVRQRYEELLGGAKSDSQRGRAYARALMQQLWSTAPWLIPYAILQTAAKWVGYRLGRLRNKKFKL